MDVYQRPFQLHFLSSDVRFCAFLTPSSTRKRLESPDSKYIHFVFICCSVHFAPVMQHLDISEADILSSWIKVSDTTCDLRSL